MPSTRPINTEHKDFVWKVFAKLHKQFDPPLSHKIKKKKQNKTKNQELNLLVGYLKSCKLHHVSVTHPL